MINADVRITPPTAASPARLYADAIARAVLIRIGRTLVEGDDGARHLIDALEDLGQVADGIVRDGELDTALADVTELAHLDAPAMDLSSADVQQLAAQATAALPTPGTVIHLPAQQNRRTA